MQTPTNIEETLWNYIDGSMEDRELDFVEELIRTNQEWLQKYAEMMEMHQVLQDDIEHHQGYRVVFSHHYRGADRVHFRTDRLGAALHRRAR